MKWTEADIAAINELTWPTNASAPLATRISALKWAFDLIRAQGEDDELADAIDDMLTECKHMARRRVETDRDALVMDLLRWAQKRTDPMSSRDSQDGPIVTAKMREAGIYELKEQGVRSGDLNQIARAVWYAMEYERLDGLDLGDQPLKVSQPGTPETDRTALAMELGRI